MATKTVDIGAQIAARRTQSGVACALGTWLTSIDSDERDQFQAAMRDRANSGRIVAEWLEDERGVQVDGNTITRHRNRECKWCKSRGLLP